MPLFRSMLGNTDTIPSLDGVGRLPLSLPIIEQTITQSGENTP